MWAADDEAWSVLTPAHMTISMWNINVWAAAEDPGALFVSMELDRIKWPVGPINHMRGCFRIQSDWENKFIMFCMLPEE